MLGEALLIMQTRILMLDDAMLRASGREGELIINQNYDREPSKDYRHIFQSISLTRPIMARKYLISCRRVFLGIYAANHFNK
jgi:hypothetical protein